MREIKCRARDNVTQTYLYSDTFPSMWQFFEELENRGIRHFETEWYTGLKDKNGVEIYEGDLLKTDKGIICKVYWSKGGASFMIYYHNVWTNKLGKLIYKKLMNWHRKTEVIGNIYENKELVK